MLFALAGCGEEASGDDGASGGSSGGNTGAAGAASGGASSGGGSSGAGSGGRPQEEGPSMRELYPLEVGWSWTYSMTPEESCAPNPGTREILEALEYEGQSDAFSITDLCGAPPFYMAYDGDDVLQWITDQGWIVALGSPIAEGSSWTVRVGEKETTFRWESVGAMETPLGTFEGCWVRRSEPTDQGNNYYCPGVGSVRRDFPGGSVWELTSFDDG